MNRLYYEKEELYLHILIYLHVRNNQVSQEAHKSLALSCRSPAASHTRRTNATPLPTIRASENKIILHFT